MDGVKSPHDYETGWYYNFRSTYSKSANDFLKSCTRSRIENALYFEQKAFGKIADTPSEAIDIVTHLTRHPNEINAMIQNMAEARQPNATQRLCQDLLDLLYNASQCETVYGKVPLYAKLLVK